MVLQLMLPLLVGLINLLEYRIKSVLHPAQHPDLVKHRRAAVISKYLAFINCLYMTLVRYTIQAFVCINLSDDLKVCGTHVYGSMYSIQLSA